MKKRFIRYVSMNVLGMVGLSCYILADTYFVSKALGAQGLCALNLAIAVYSVIHALGLMLGIGGGTQYGIMKAQGNVNKADTYFTLSAKLALITGGGLALIGILFADKLALLLGADSMTLELTQTYLCVILCFAPMFILNNVFLAFVRNDHAPNLAMCAMLAGSFLNIVLDYVFMFPLHMGMFGAALATGLAPICSMGVLSFHKMKHKNGFHFTHAHMRLIQVRTILLSGMSAFVTELSSGILLMAFNLTILPLAGNVGVAAYGIVANVALVIVALFVGIAQGVQPLWSESYAKNDMRMLRRLKSTALMLALGLGALVYAGTWLFADGIIAIFNQNADAALAAIAKEGFQLYFLGFLFAGMNIVLAAYMSAAGRERRGFMLSLMRGFIVILPLVWLFSALFQMTGVWLSFAVTEAICLMTAAIDKSRLVGYHEKNSVA